MNLDDLKRDATHRLKRIERAVALDLLGGNLTRAETRRFRCLQKLDASVYLHPGERIELHRRLLPERDDRYLGGARFEKRILRWALWTPCRVDTFTGTCVRLLVPGWGSQPWTTTDFVCAVLDGYVRPPVQKL